ncbi:transposase [Nostoc sp. 'Peltigera membranacea cyanobiont' 232]|uniref:transposase n=1 Tax=Nostoc sp. 'Peltigera membranacea cyanobiont' 232 TaxID=2014531 RepID=UPI000B95151E|nr:transposase [Nostoc sp. 'Peltigera membranacea cyanobiont' 232]OYE01189.1 transposase [Nostoc sp. 'Peltigera membranacea cyanobiont' 232]
MPRPRAKDTEQDKLARFERIKKTITALEKQQALLLKQGTLAVSGAWVARYQVRQNLKKYWYYKLQVPIPYFQCATSNKLSKYKHLGKAGTDVHIDAVMSVFRRSVWNEIQKIIDTLDDCLLDISSGSEQEEENPQD